MSDIVAPLILGRRFSYSSIELAVLSGGAAQEILVDVTEISYSESLVIASKNGTASVPLGSTRGVWESQEGRLVIGKSSFNNMVQKIGPGYLGINFSMLVAYADIGEPLCTDAVLGRIMGIEDSHSYGPDPLNVSLTIRIEAPIIRNGMPSMLNRVF